MCSDDCHYYRMTLVLNRTGQPEVMYAFRIVTTSAIGFMREVILVAALTDSRTNTPRLWNRRRE